MRARAPSASGRRASTWGSCAAFGGRRPGRRARARSRTQAGRGRVPPGRTAACGHGGASRRGRSRRPGRVRRRSARSSRRAICSTGRRRASARRRIVRVARKRPCSSTSPGISSGGDSGRSSPSPTNVRWTPTSRSGCALANSTASAVAGMAGMIEALVSAPCSKHSMVARTVSADAPKSSACRTIRMRLASFCFVPSTRTNRLSAACTRPSSTRGGTRCCRRFAPFLELHAEDHLAALARPRASSSVTQRLRRWS